MGVLVVGCVVWGTVYIAVRCYPAVLQACHCLRAFLLEVIVVSLKEEEG